MGALDSFGELGSTRPLSAFYLAASEEFAGQADAAIVVQGHELPVHSQILSQHSRVLCSMFAGCKRARFTVRVAKPFDAYSACTVTGFLRCLYHPDDATAANFRQLGNGLFDLVELAQQLGTRPLLAKLEAHLNEAVTSTSVEEAVRWIQLAEKFQQSDLRLRCIHHIATQLGAGSKSTCHSSACGPRKAKAAFWHALADVSSLKGLSEDAMLAVMAACVTGLWQHSLPYSYIPSMGELERALLPKRGRPRLS